MIRHNLISILYVRKQLFSQSFLDEVRINKYIKILWISPELRDLSAEKIALRCITLFDRIKLIKSVNYSPSVQSEL